MLGHTEYELPQSTIMQLEVAVDLLTKTKTSLETNYRATDLASAHLKDRSQEDMVDTFIEYSIMILCCSLKYKYNSLYTEMHYPLFGNGPSA